VEQPSLELFQVLESQLLEEELESYAVSQVFGQTFGASHICATATYEKNIFGTKNISQDVGNMAQCGSKLPIV